MAPEAPGGSAAGPGRLTRTVPRALGIPASRGPHGSRARRPGLPRPVTCMNSAYDSYSTNFEVFPLKAKSQAPRSTDQYFRQAKTRGVDIDRGGVLYRDNEIVLNSAKMNEVAVAHNQTNKTSIEYEPTGNAGVESVFRILPHEMRKNAIRSGMPDEFWDYNAIDCAELLAATRCREGPDGTKMSVGEKFDGKRPSLSKRRVWGCLVVAKKYPTWIEGKLDDRGVAGVNLGRSRTQPGYCVWTPEYGVFVSKHVVFYETEFPFLDGTFALQRRSTGGGAATGGGFAPTTEQTATEDDNDSDDNNRRDDHVCCRGGAMERPTAWRAAGIMAAASVHSRSTRAQTTRS